MSKQTKILSFDEARAHSSRRGSVASSNPSNNGRYGANSQRSSRDASSYSRYNSQATSEYSSRRNNAGYRQQSAKTGADVRARVAQNARSNSYSSMNRFEQESYSYTSRSASPRVNRQQANRYQRSDAEFRDLRNPRSVRGVSSRANSYAGKPFAEEKYAVRNSWDKQEDEQDFDETSSRYNRDEELSTKEKLIKKFRSSKAEKQFDRTIGQDDVPQESGSRAAVYEMKMGKTHRRSAEMQSGNEGKRSGKKNSFSFAMPLQFLTTKVGIFLVGLLICGGLLYQPAADYYNETRKVQQLEAEYQALQEHNQKLKSEVDFLQTDEGMIDYGRDQYGLILAGEKQATVENVTSSVNHTTVKDANHTVLTSGVKTPSTWYSGVLDVVFGYKG